MLIACASDAHGEHKQMERLMRQMPGVDAFCFLGDCDSDANWLEAAFAEQYPKATFLAVVGNNDPFSERPGTILYPFAETRGLITHGHLFRAKYTLKPLAAFAGSQGCGFALFGHTHCQMETTKDGVLLVNPGALNQGRWALIEIASKIHVELLVL